MDPKSLMVGIATLIVFPLSMAAAAFCDLRSMIIPNRISVILVAAFLVLAPLSGLAWPVIGLHVLAGAIVFTVCFALFMANVMGGGDVKLLAACAVWFGLGPGLLSFLVTTAMAGGVLTLTLIALRRVPAFQAALVRYSLPPHLADRTAGVPYGIAIAIAGLVCYPQTELMSFALHGLG